MTLVSTLECVLRLVPKASVFLLRQRELFSGAKVFLSPSIDWGSRVTTFDQIRRKLIQCSFVYIPLGSDLFLGSIIYVHFALYSSREAAVAQFSQT